MKKILIIFLFSAFLVPAFVLAKEASVEKIPDPSQIKFFKVMKNENGALYGIRIKEAKVASNTKAIADAPKIASSSSLEKIAGPWAIGLYEKIMKIGNALWGQKKEVADNLGKVELTPEVIACLKLAINKKDEAMKTTVSDSATGLTKAITERDTCQKAALDLSANLERVKAFKVCKDSFNQAVKDVRLTAKKARNEVWKTYQQEVKACRDSSASSTSASAAPALSEAGNLLLDDGGENLDL